LCAHWQKHDTLVLSNTVCEQNAHMEVVADLKNLGKFKITDYIAET